MSLQRYFDVSEASDIPVLQNQLVAFANLLEFPLVTAAVVVDVPGAKDGPILKVIGNTPEAFKSMQLDPVISRRDPVIKRLKALSVPFIYDQALYVSEGAGQLWEHQASYGFRTGIAVALHLPGHKHFLLGVDRDQPLPADESKLIRMMADLQLLAVHAQSAAMRLILSTEPPENLPRFTPRENEVLRWCMEGKSTWQTAKILNVSESAVNWHIRNACAKMGVASKHQAVLKAISLNLLS
ncbi:MAG: LuxR C-terminal-related transcriptional regulator [Rubrivivax sp.]